MAVTPFKRDFYWYVTTLVAIVAILSILWWYAPQPRAPKPTANAYYVWQMRWTDAVRDAITTVEDRGSFMVLVGEVYASKDGLTFKPAYPDWKFLAQRAKPVTVVLRANVGLSTELESPRRSDAVAFVNGTIARILAAARDAKVVIDGLQLDYDCPSAKLATYESLLAEVRAQHPVPLSITALPTWLRWSEFPDLVRNLDYYVLQVHSLEAPKTVNDPVVLCDTARIPAYLRRAAQIDVPFYLALPTYGYRFAFDDTGKFAAIIAEGPEPILKPGYQLRTAMADPAEIAAVVNDLRAQPPHNLRGIAWFRLPIATDTLNWPWPTLEAVSQGRAPTLAFTADLRSPSPGLYEIWIENTGENDASANVNVVLQYRQGEVVASDTHNGYDAKAAPGGTGVTLTGPAPRPQQEVLAAWFRTRDPQPAETKAPAITVGPVISVPN